MTEVLENIVEIMNNAPKSRWNEIGILISNKAPYGVISFMSIEEIKELEKEIKRTLGKGLN